MKSVYEAATRDELVARIRMLTENSRAQWGKMTVFQMLKHCSRWDEMAMSGKKYKRVFMGRIFGRMALRQMIQRDRPMGRSMPTIPELIVKENGSVAVQKEKWIGLIEKHGGGFNPGFVHPFFGKMTREEVGLLAYKHADHHLRQFAC